MAYWEKIDIQLTDWLFLDRPGGAGQWLLLLIASGVVYLLPIFLLVEFFYRRRRLTALKATIVGLVAWLAVASPLGDYLYNQFGWRDRPFADFGSAGLDSWLFEAPFKAFPSDHSALLLAIGLVYLASSQRHLAKWLLALTAAVGLGRVMIGFHFVGDILGGWLIALVVFTLARLANRPLERLITWGLKIIRLPDG